MTDLLNDNRRPDASMQLLNTVLSETVDPDYALAAAKRRSLGRAPVVVGVVSLLAGLMIATSAATNTRAAPASQQERAALIQRIEAANTVLSEQRAEATTLQADIDRLRREGRSGDADVVDEIERLGPLAGAAAVTGPGVVLVVHDGPAQIGEKGLVIDQDLRQTVNGLWQAGAEAIAINGYRLSARTAIRQAGAAITVDYRSLIAPYRIEAIGDPRTLGSRFANSDGGVWLSFLANNYGINHELTTSNSLNLETDPGLDVNHAIVGES